MKKRQRKKNAKKAIKRLQAIICLVQAQALLSQLYINRRIYKTGGAVPINQAGELVSVNNMGGDVESVKKYGIDLTDKEQ